MPARRRGRSETVVQGRPPSIPTSASEHPAKWKFDFPIYHPPDLAAWRAWLTANHDTVEDLVEPDDLAEALDDRPAARNAWAGFPPSARKQMLWWIVSAARPETRTNRIATIVADAASGRRAQG